jgi:hypothetical protein
VHLFAQKHKKIGRLRRNETIWTGVSLRGTIGAVESGLNPCETYSLALPWCSLRPPRTPRPDGTTYTNVGFAFAVDYPRDIFTGYAEPDNSDGATFKTDAPWVEMRAWGSYNVEKKSPRACVAERYAGKNQNTTLDYSSVKRDSFVVSGIERGAVGRAPARAVRV